MRRGIRWIRSGRAGAQHPGAVECEFGDVTVDLLGITYIGSSGISAVVEIRNSLHETEHELWLVGLTPRTRRTFMIAGLEALLA